MCFNAGVYANLCHSGQTKSLLLLIFLKNNLSESYYRKALPVVIFIVTFPDVISYRIGAGVVFDEIYSD